MLKASWEYWSTVTMIVLKWLAGGIGCLLCDFAGIPVLRPDDQGAIKRRINQKRQRILHYYESRQTWSESVYLQYVEECREHDTMQAMAASLIRGYKPVYMGRPSRKPAPVNGFRVA